MGGVADTGVDERRVDYPGGGPVAPAPADASRTTSQDASTTDETSTSSRGDTSVPCVVIGASRAQRVPACVCASSILEHCPDAEIVQVFERTLPRWRAHMGTPFSLVRFWAPELRGYAGRSIYVDSDMLALRSVRELWSLDMAGAAVLRPPNQAAVLLLDCSRLRAWNVATLISDVHARRRDPRVVMTQLAACDDPAAQVRDAIPASWNVLDAWAPDAALLHYTRLPTQPWTAPGHRSAGYWFAALRRALRAQRVPRQWIMEDVAAGHLGAHILEVIE